MEEETGKQLDASPKRKRYFAEVWFSGIETAKRAGALGMEAHGFQ